MTEAVARSLRISDLRPGARFLIPATGETGTVVRLAHGWAVVRMDGERRRSFETSKGTAVEFVARNRPVEIALGTEVEPIDV